MKLKALLLALFTAGFAVSIAVAASPAAIDNKGKPTTSTSTDGSTTSASHEARARARATDEASVTTPRRRASAAKKIVVTGEFVAAGAGGFAMKVTGGNKAAKAWKDKQATVLVDDKTRFNGKKHALADLVAGDRRARPGLRLQGRRRRGLAARPQGDDQAPEGRRGRRLDDHHHDDDDHRRHHDDAATTTTP